jgi:SET domain-containing protein
MPPIPGLRVILSPVHGYGVIAERPIADGDIIVHGDGVVYRETDDYDDTYSLLLAVDESGPEPMQLLYDLTDQTRWINHSCAPNTYVDTSWDPDTKTATAWWVATRDIAVGEELFYDYAFSAELAEPCACGAPTCRGLIIDEDEMHLVDQIPAHHRHLLRARPQPNASSAAARPSSPR